MLNLTDFVVTLSDSGSGEQTIVATAHHKIQGWIHARGPLNSKLRFRKISLLSLNTRTRNNRDMVITDNKEYSRIVKNARAQVMEYYVKHSKH